MKMPPSKRLELEAKLARWIHALDALPVLRESFPDKTNLWNDVEAYYNDRIEMGERALDEANRSF